jgi:hypothetical protein
LEGYTLTVKSTKAANFRTAGTYPSPSRKRCRYPFNLLPMFSSSPEWMRSFAW